MRWQAHERYNLNFLAPLFKSGGTFVMVWGAFKGFEKSPLVIIPSAQQFAIDFVNLTNEGTFSGFYYMHDQPHELTLMEDCAPLHRSRYLEHWIEAHGIKKMNWPPNSWDLNPIENMWKIVKDLLRHNNRLKNKTKMIELI